MQPASPQRHSATLWAEISTLTLMGMDTAWVSVWYQYTQAGRTPWWEAIAALFALELGSHFLARVFNFLRIKRSIRIGAFFVWLVLIQILTLNALVYRWQPRGEIFSGLALAEALHVLVITLLALRGVTLATSALDSWGTQGSFRAGILLLGLYFLITSADKSSLAIIPVGLFLLMGLLSLSATRIADLSVSRGGRVPPFRWRSWLSVAGLAAAAVGLGMLTGQVFGEIIGKLLMGIFTGLLAIVLLAGLLISVPLVGLIQLLISVIKPEYNRKAIEALQQSVQQTAATMLDLMEQAAEKIINWEETARLWVVGIILAIAIILIIRRLNAARIRRAEAGEDERRNVSRVQRIPTRPEANRGKPRSAAQVLAAARVRRACGQLMGLCAALEHPRPPAATPLEFLPALQRLFPGHQEQADQITQVYTQIRYGEYPELEAEVQQVLDGWRQIQAEGRRKLTELRREKLNLRRITPKP